jgi:hypothetical protein
MCFGVTGNPQASWLVRRAAKSLLRGVAFCRKMVAIKTIQ